MEVQVQAAGVKTQVQTNVDQNNYCNYRSKEMGCF